MNRETIIYVIIFLIVGGFCGFFIKSCTIVKPLPQTSHIDTIFVTIPPITKIETHYITKPVFIYKDSVTKLATFTDRDSLLIDTLGIKGKVGVAVTVDSLKTKWEWSQWLQLPPKMTIVDSIYVPQIVLQNKPFLQDGWFYGSVGLFLLSFLYLLGIL